VSATTLVVERAGHAVAQDLGRPSHGSIGISVNGALDEGAARTANLLVGNAEGAPLVEVTDSELSLVTESDLLLSVTGAAETVVIDGHRQPSWETLAVSAGARVVVPAPVTGYRSYLAVNGTLRAHRDLGSVSPDHLLGVGTPITAGDRLVVDSRYNTHAPAPLGRVFRLGARRPRMSARLVIRVTEGPDLARLSRGRDALTDVIRLLPQSDHVGLRLACAPLKQTSSEEIVSRGVPVGAVEVPPTGGIIILLRGRLITAGYPVVAVVTTESLDLLAQARPGDSVTLSFCDVAAAHAALHARAAERSALAARVCAAFTAKGLADVLDPCRHTTTTRGSTT